MKKSFKLKMISLLGLALCVAMAFGMLMFARPTHNASALSYASGEFEMLGMSIRYSEAEGDDGIRFGVKLKRSIYDTLVADDDAVAGIFVIPYDAIQKDKGDGNRYLDIFTAARDGAQYGILYDGTNNINNWEVGSEYAEGIVYLHGFPAASFNRPIAARGYIDWDNNSGTVYYADTVKVSMSDVALSIRTDYEGSNEYGTTSDQYAKLDNYLNTYTVSFYDEFWNEYASQDVKFGNSFAVPSAPTARTGYTLDGWTEQIVGGYSSSVIDMSAAANRVVKYNRGYHATYSKTVGAQTFEKPAIGAGLHDHVGPTCAVSSDDNTYALSLKGCRFMSGATVADSAPFMVQMTFTAVSGNVEYGFLVTDDYTDGQGRMLYRGGKFYFYNYTSGTYNDQSWAWYDSIEQKTNISSVTLTAGTEYTMTLIYKNSKYIVYIGDKEAVEFSETDSLQSNYGSTKHVSDLVGTGSTKYLGIMSLNGDNPSTISDWRYSTDVDLINDFMKLETIGNKAPSKFEITSSEATIGGGNGAVTAYFPNASIPQNTNFVIYATAKSGNFSGHIGFVVGTLADANKHLMFRWRSGDIYITRENPSWAGHADNLWTPGYDDNSEDKEIALVYEDGIYYLFMNGAKVWQAPDSGTSNGWNGSLGISSNIGTSGNKRIGLIAQSGTVTYKNYGYSTNSAVIKGYTDNIPEDRILGSWLYGNNTGTTQGTRGNVDLKVKGAYLLKNAEVANGSDYLLDATFTRADGATEMGFVITTNGSWGGEVKNLMFVYRKTQGDMYFRSNGIWHSLGAVTAPAAGSEFHLQIVHKLEQFFVFINGTKVAEVSENATQDGGASPKNAIGTSGNIKFGLVSLSGLTSFSDWGYTTDAAAIAELVPDPEFITLAKPSKGSWLYANDSGTGISDDNLNLKGAHLLSGAEVETGTSYMMQVAFTRSSSSEFGFVVTTDNNWNGTQKNLWIVCKKDSGKFYVWGENPGLWWNIDSNVVFPAEGNKMVMTLIYQSGTYKIFINGALAASFSETTKGEGWNRTMASVLTGETTYLGLVSMNAVTTFNNWTVTNDPTVISNFTSATSSRPALGTWQFAAISDDNGVSGSNLKVKGAYLLNGATVTTGSSYMLTATFTNTGAPELGFVVTTDNNWNGTQKNLLIVRRSSDLYVWGENPGLWWGVSSDVSIPSSGSTMTMTLVYKSGNYKIFINGALAATCSETTKGEGWNRTMASVLTGETTYLGLVSTNAVTTFTNWAFSTDATTIDYLAG